jgi:hypothetical protein
LAFDCPRICDHLRIKAGMSVDSGGGLRPLDSL